MKRMIVIGALVALCAVAALTSANAKEPAANSRLKEMVAARMASPKGMTENDVPKGKVSLRMATPAGKYAQNGNAAVQNFALEDDESNQALLEEAKRREQELREQLGEDGDDGDAVKGVDDRNTITWWKPKKVDNYGDSGNEGIYGGSDNPGGFGGGNGQFGSYDPTNLWIDPCGCGFCGSCYGSVFEGDCFDCFDYCGCDCGCDFGCEPECRRSCIPVLRRVISGVAGRRLR